MYGSYLDPKECLQCLQCNNDNLIDKLIIYTVTRHTTYCELMDIISTGLPHLLKAPQNQKVCSKLLRTPQKDMIFGKSSSNLLKFTFTCSKVIFDMSFVLLHLKKISRDQY